MCPKLTTLEEGALESVRIFLLQQTSFSSVQDSTNTVLEKRQYFRLAAFTRSSETIVDFPAIDIVFTHNDLLGAHTVT